MDVPCSSQCGGLCPAAVVPLLKLPKKGDALVDFLDVYCVALEKASFSRLKGFLAKLHLPSIALFPHLS